MLKFGAFKLSDFWLNVSKLATGTVLAQVTGILLTPIIMRIFDAKDIGMLNIFNQIVGFFLVISVLRLDRAVVLSNQNDAHIILRAGLQLIGAFTLLITLITLPFASFWFNKLNLDYPLVFILALPVSFLLQSTINLFKAGGNSFSLYGMMAKAIILQSLFVHILKIVFGLNLGAGPAWLILAEIIGSVSTILFLWWSLYYRVNFQIKWLPISRMLELLKSQKRFLQYDVPAAILNFGSSSIATFLLAYFFNAKVVGYYALGFMMLRLPMNLLGKAIGDVFYKNAANQAKSVSELRKSSSYVVITLFSFGLLPMAGIFFFGDVLFSFFFGKEWIPAGEFSQILSIYTLIWFISSPISNLYYVLNMQHRFMRVMLSSLVLRSLAITLGAIYYDAITTIFFFSIVSFLVYGYQVIFLLNAVDVNFGSFFKNIFISSKFAIIPLMVMIILDYLSLGTPKMMLILFPVVGAALIFRWFKKPTLNL
jgi:O-antigen/teichoic acid export membrane protein